MRALTRMRTLAAVCALLLTLAGTATAGIPGKPIDRPDPPENKPPMVGDPDEPPSFVSLVILNRVMIFRLRGGISLPLIRDGSVRTRGATRGERHAR